MTIRAVSSGITTTVTKMNTGTAAPAANGVLTSFTIPHGLGTAPSFADAKASNALSNALYFITSDSTNITITYAVAPLTGTLGFSWIAVS